MGWGVGAGRRGVKSAGGVCAGLVLQTELLSAVKSSGPSWLRGCCPQRRDFLLTSWVLQPVLCYMPVSQCTLQ